MHVSQDELLALIEQAKQKIQIGGRYRHYKSASMTYTVKDIVINEADNEPYVIYQAEYGYNITFARPVRVWLEQAAFEGRLVPRFTLISG